MLTNMITDEELYQRQLDYEIMLKETEQDLYTDAMYFAEEHYAMLVYLGKERFVDTIVSSINKYCKKENIQ